MSIGLIAALPTEVHGLVNTRAKPGQRLALQCGGWLQLSGIGRVRAEKAAYSLVDAGTRALVSWGVAGGLNPGVKCGTLVVPGTVISNNGTEFPVDPRWHTVLSHRLAQEISVTTEPLAESLAYLADSAHKAQLFDRTGACVVDMESAAIARVAQESNLPFVAVRAVLDTAELGLPMGAVNALGPDGHLRIDRLVSALVKHPSEVASLVKLAKALRHAQASLAKAAEIAGPNLGFPAKKLF